QRGRKLIPGHVVLVDVQQLQLLRDLREGGIVSLLLVRRVRGEQALEVLVLLRLQLELPDAKSPAFLVLLDVPAQSLADELVLEADLVAESYKWLVTRSTSHASRTHKPQNAQSQRSPQSASSEERAET